MRDFDKIIDRRNTNSLKHDFAVENGLPEDVMPMWVADMDFKAPECVLEALQNSVDHGIFGYSNLKDDYYQAVAGWFTRHFAWTPEKEWLVQTPGVVYALAMAVRAFTEKGEGVIIQPPVYYPFYNVIRNNQREIIESPLVYADGKYTIDFGDFEKKIVDNGVKLFILCSPHNPICRVWTKQELQKLGAICKKHNVIIVADEIHCDFTYEGHDHNIFYEAVPEMADRTIICTAPSKTFNIAGLQCSNIWIKSEELRQRYNEEIAASGYTVPNTLGVVACKAAYEKGDDWYEECWAYIKDNLAYVREFVKENLPGVKLVEPEGTYFAWLDCSGLGLTAEELNNLIIHKAGLWLDAGDIFGKIAEQFQRVVLACPRATVEKAMNQLKNAVEEIKK
ncbi:MAG: pyridoxal phosphate-dependent aminotransferase [Clostridia bacterium]|nr:pyridoxal phosphate-dependent aminotransferase [Clostridia bacterium]